jgi:CheY-like chemotaxis protein
LVTAGWSVDHPVLSTAQQVIAFTVEDTGVGIAAEKQKLIFEAFQQADAGTSRRVLVSRSVANSHRSSTVRSSWRACPGKAAPSRSICPFTRQMEASTSSSTRAHSVTVLPTVREEHIEDDRDAVVSGEPLVLIIENDPHYGRLLLGLVRDKGFTGIVAANGSIGLSLARACNPIAISLDILLPDMLGWAVLRQLKLDPNTRHIPVQIVTVAEERQHGLAHGAFVCYAKEPTTDGLKIALDRLKEFTAPHEVVTDRRG